MVGINATPPAPPLLHRPPAPQVNIIFLLVLGMPKQFGILYDLVLIIALSMAGKFEQNTKVKKSLGGGVPRL